jgi:8-oxo-dGTP pyrophosphatase MutT (NUDIX family)
VGDVWCFLIFSPGGAIHKGESPDDAAVRETFEEAGCNIVQYMNSSSVYHFPKCIIYYINVDPDITVNGASPKHAWEVSGNKIKGGTPIGSTGWFWVVLSHAINLSIKEHGLNHYFTKNLQRI